MIDISLDQPAFRLVAISKSRITAKPLEARTGRETLRALDDVDTSPKKGPSWWRS